MRNTGFGMRPDNTPLTASIGIAERGADQAADWRSLVELADQRMHLAKSAGRNTLRYHSG
jgi:GGDEF domain-containing protein